MTRMSSSREVIDERFTIEQLAGFGGMGQLYKARDQRTGAVVALKVMHDAERIELGRFARESAVLAELSHPGIVRYLDSGLTAEGEPYLVMEWLSGETLSAYLARAQLTVAQTVALGRRIASALAAVHRAGVVHRDLKPSNLFLPGGAIDKVCLIDFGMARRPLVDPKLTVTGTMLGTPGYVAPEQVYNLQSLDGRADLFSLGCVLYRCVAGHAPFRGPDALRTLLNGTPEQLARLREFHPAIAPELDALVARLLSRSPDDRPASGDIVAAELAALEDADATRSAGAVPPLLTAERRLACLVLARLSRRSGGPGETSRLDRALAELAARHRGKLELVSDRLAAIALTGADAATDLALRAARCARALQALLGKEPMAVVSGREVLSPGVSETDLFYRALDLVEATERRAAIRIDDLTAGLVAGRFDTGKTGRQLRNERRPAGPCVGRDQELEQLAMIFSQCADERVASMVLISGSDGIGKSRLGDEFLRRVATRGDAVAIWRAEADPLATGKVFGVLGELVRNALQIASDEAADSRRDKLRAWFEHRAPQGDTRHVDALAALVAGPVDDGAAPPGPILASDQIAQAFLGFVRAECAVRPVVLALDDLHWGDVPTLKLIYAALRELADRPLLVLALARPHVQELFPQLWADRCVQEIRLRKLSRRASAQRVLDVLGGAASDDTARALVDRSDRHPAYLEVLLRAVVDGRGWATPATVLAMAQTRLEKLDPEARRVLRAASVFGDTFWRSGVEALAPGRDTAAWLGVLVDHGVIELGDATGRPGDAEYRFAHSVIREAAHEMLTEEDRVAARRLAAQWREEAEANRRMIEETRKRSTTGEGPDTPL